MDTGTVRTQCKQVIAELRDALQQLAWSASQEGTGDSGVDAVIRTARVAIQTLDGEALGFVLGDGGPHGSPERALLAWKDLAWETFHNIRTAAKFQRDWLSTEGLLQHIGETAVVAATNVAAGLGRGLDSVDRIASALPWVAVGLVAWLLLGDKR